MGKLVILDDSVSQELVRRRRRFGHDHRDEVWDGTYVSPPIADIRHQELVSEFALILIEVVRQLSRHCVFPGANVSDRRYGWMENYRCPDVVVVLEGGRAIDCDTHWYGGPDFLLEVEMPGEDVTQKLPFYAAIGVRELLLIHRGSGRLSLFRHDGSALAPVGSSALDGYRYLCSAVVPLAFRRRVVRGVGPRVEVVRTDGSPQTWLV